MNEMISVTGEAVTLGKSESPWEPWDFRASRGLIEAQRLSKLRLGQRVWPPGRAGPSYHLEKDVYMDVYHVFIACLVRCQTSRRASI